jgi:hypothetical protein
MTRKERLIKLATKRGDKAALAILEADRDFRPEPTDHYIFAAPIVRYVKAGLRWDKAA